MTISSILIGPTTGTSRRPVNRPSVFFEITNLGLVAFLLIKHFCAHKLYTTVKVNSAVHYKSMQLLMRKKTSYYIHCLNTDKYLQKYLIY